MRKGERVESQLFGARGRVAVASERMARPAQRLTVGGTESTWRYRHNDKMPLYKYPDSID